jgi:hypothetical protein
LIDAAHALDQTIRTKYGITPEDLTRLLEYLEEVPESPKWEVDLEGAPPGYVQRGSVALDTGTVGCINELEDAQLVETLQNNLGLFKSLLRWYILACQTGQIPERMLQSEQIRPIVDSWKREVEVQKELLAQALRDLKNISRYCDWFHVYGDQELKAVGWSPAEYAAQAYKRITGEKV